MFIKLLVNKGISIMWYYKIPVGILSAFSGAYLGMVILIGFFYALFIYIFLYCILLNLLLFYYFIILLFHYFIISLFYYLLFILA